LTPSRPYSHLSSLLPPPPLYRCLHHFRHLISITTTGGRGSLVSIVTSMGWTSRFRFPAGAGSFLSSHPRPNRLWGPHSILTNRHRGSFPRGKAAGAWSWPYSRSGKVKNVWRYTPPPPRTPSRCGKGKVVPVLLLRTTPWRCIGGGKVWLHTFFISALDGGGKSPWSQLDRPGGPHSRSGRGAPAGTSNHRSFSPLAPLHDVAPNWAQG
jgi:hypothetical protein